MKRRALVSFYQFLMDICKGFFCPKKRKGVKKMREKITNDGSADYGTVVDPNRFITFEEAVRRGKILESKPRQPAPRFHHKAVIPDVPEGMQLVKFHGEPALIPAQQEGDEMFGKSRFTVKQFDALMELEGKRKRRALLENLDQYPYPVQYVVGRIHQMHPDAF